MKVDPDMIQLALKAIETFLMADPGKQMVQKEYDGYAASLGAAIRTSGLIPALVFYTDIAKEKNNTEPRRFRLLQAIAFTMGRGNDQAEKKFLLDLVLKEIYGEAVYDPNLKQRPEANELIRAELTRKILNASVALKLALRNFQHTD